MEGAWADHPKNITIFQNKPETIHGTFVDNLVIQCISIKTENWKNDMALAFVQPETEIVWSHY